MGSIVARRRKDGTTGYTAQIRLKKRGLVIHSEAETFDKKALAQEWLRRRQAELDQHRARGTLVGAKDTLRSLLIWYRETVGPTANWGRSKEADLRRIEGYAIAAKVASTLTVADYIEHAMTRRDEGAGPATIGNDLIWIGQVLKSARASLNIPARLDLLTDARHELRARRMLVKSRWRDRRLKPDEETQLLKHFESRDCRSKIPMATIMRYAILSSRRQEEITEVRHSNLERIKSIGWLDDVKHPTQKVGNRRSFRMLPEAWAIIDAQPRQKNEDRVFPYNPKSIGAAFTRACHLLGIKNLHFHDLRHEATSRLFERGYAIQEVQQFTLHESWQTLQRYTHLRPEHLIDR